MGHRKPGKAAHEALLSVKPFLEVSQSGLHQGPGNPQTVPLETVNPMKPKPAVAYVA